MEGILDILGRVGFNWKIALANLVNFLIVFYLLNRFVFSKLRKTIDERERRIAGGLDNAEKAAEELRKAEEDREAIVRNAHREAGTIVQMAHDQGKVMVSEAVEKSREEAAGVIAAAEGEIARKEKEMNARVREHAVKAAVAATEKLLKGSVDKHKSEELAREALNL